MAEELVQAHQIEKQQQEIITNDIKRQYFKRQAEIKYKHIFGDKREKQINLFVEAEMERQSTEAFSPEEKQKLNEFIEKAQSEGSEPGVLESALEFAGLPNPFSNSLNSVDIPDREDEEYKKSQDERAQTIRLAKQSYLLVNIEQLAAASKRDYTSGNKTQKQFARIEHDYPYELNNLLFSVKPKYDILINSTNLDLSMLVPKIRIFKEYSVDNSKKLIEFPFEDFANEEDFSNMLNDRSGRGSGVGVKSFSWHTIGTNSASKYAFSSELELFFQNIEDLDKVRRVDTLPTGKKIETRYSDLILTNTQYLKSGDGQNVYNPDYFRIKVMIGWHVPNSISGVSKEFIEEMSRNNLSLYMSLIDHKLTINDDSSIKLELNFTSYVESLINYAKNSNVLVTQYEKEISELEERYKELGERYGEKEDDDTVKAGIKSQQEALSKQIEEKKKSVGVDRYQKFVISLIEKKLMRTVELNQESLNNLVNLLNYKPNGFTDEQQIKDYNQKIRNIRDSLYKQGQPNDTQTMSVDPGEDPDGQSVEVSDDSNMTPVNPSIGEIYDPLNDYPGEWVNYFYFGDLLENVLQDMYLDENVAETDFSNKQIKIMLGPIFIYDYGELVDGSNMSNGSILSKPAGIYNGTNEANVTNYFGKATSINVSDVPISLDLFEVWFNKNIIDKGLINMALKEFVDLVLNDLVIRVLANETYGFAPRQKARLVYKPFSLPADESRFKPEDPRLFSYRAESFRDNPLKDTRNTWKEEEKVENYILIYGYGENAFNLNSNYEEDSKRGIRHLLYGTEKGLVKKINFTKVDDPLFRKHNLRLAVQNGGAGTSFMRGVYNANVEMYGNCLFDIGQSIYIAPTFYGSSKLGDRVKFVKDLGVGGYFNIIKISNTIAEGKFDTKLDLMWQARGDGTSNINEIAVKLKKPKPAS